MSGSLNNLGVFSEVGTLKSVIVHCPDLGIGRVVPSKAQEWLYEDIVHLKKMQKEFEYFRKILLAYLDPQALSKWIIEENQEAKEPLLQSRAEVGSKNFISSSHVIDVEEILIQVLSIDSVRQQIVAAICAIEELPSTIQAFLQDSQKINAEQLAKTLITGIIEQNVGVANFDMIFAPIPNFIFTRDIGITIGTHFLLSKTASKSRKRESILAKYIGYYVLCKGDINKIIEVAENKSTFLLNEKDQLRQLVTIEGGDVMMIAPKHLLIGCSERTTLHACEQVIHKLFNLKDCAIEKVSIVKLPHTRAMMHLDTVLTQVDRKTWVLFKQLVSIDAENLSNTIFHELIGKSTEYEERLAKVSQFIKNGTENLCDVNPQVTNLIELLMDVSCNDYGCIPQEVQFIHSAEGRAIYDEREQWTDSCNVVAIKEGVVLGYDRNNLTANGFEKAGFKPVYVKELLDQLSEQMRHNSSLNIPEYLEANVPKKALLMLPSAELSRARGGPHCMTMPIIRDYVL